VTRAQHRTDTSVSTPAANNIITGERDISGHETRTITPILDNNRIKWTNVPKQPIPELQDISLWIGHQLNHKRMPKEFTDVPPNGKLLTSIKGHPEGLLAIPNVDGFPRIIVPIYGAIWYLVRLSTQSRFGKRKNGRKEKSRKNKFCWLLDSSQ
jgi:hypothetical protein